MKKVKSLLTVCLICFVLAALLGGCSDETRGRFQKMGGRFFSPSKVSSSDDLNLSGDGVSYSFTYDGEDYYAEYLSDTWRIYNSYKIKSSRDILAICRALCQEHKVPSKDREGFRTPEDMAFEWEQHNIAYDQLPEGNYWRESSRNVDLDPDDQGKTFKEIYEERTGKKLDLDMVVDHKDKITEKVKEKLNKEDLDLDNLDLDRLDWDRIKQKVKEKIKEKINEE